ncbi:hypothetical protein Taro_034978 [Colocasia esculenta]|uniref:Carbohydrate kinase PfkB domain-containing protein n=1 Tax=Colocasia esculenta TaxID=4460 RepID=A0A843VT05_COLES|nr:hypothetical protein [Colocasia esculenta]
MTSLTVIVLQNQHPKELNKVSGGFPPLCYLLPAAASKCGVAVAEELAVGLFPCPHVSKRPSRRSRKKAPTESSDNLITETVDKTEDEGSLQETPAENAKKTSRKGRIKASVPSLNIENMEDKASEGLSSSDAKKTEKKASKKKTKKKIASSDDESISEETSNLDVQRVFEDEGNLLAVHGEEEDISYTYSWPPLVCCFGAAQHAFVPSGRLANRLIDHEMHETKRDMFWCPDRFVRAPGGSSSSVAIAVAGLGGRVAFMGKLGDDEYGQIMLYHLNVNDVQTRSVKIDSSKSTALSRMKISKRGGLKMSCIRPCAEDGLLGSEINIDVLKEAKMFYFNSSSLLDESMRRTTMQAIKVSKQLGGVIFFDLNLPLPLWQSNRETKALIKDAWETADVIELTKQELEFLCGITPIEKFDTKDNDKSKFLHHQREVIQPLWHEKLKVLFVTNGTSKIHYYTEKDNGWVRGMEDAPITPFTGDMSVSGDAIVAALMRMLTVQPHLATDKGYLEHMCNYAITCGVIDQWTVARVRGFPPKEGMEGVPSENGVISISEKEFRTVASPAN